MRTKSIILLFTGLLLIQPTLYTSETESQTITREELRDHVYFLASDFLNGRDPGDSGYEIACQYAAAQFRAMGMKPVLKDSNGESTYFQNVPLVERWLKDFALVMKKNGKQKSIPLGKLLKISLFDLTQSPLRDAPVVFAGYGIQEPQAGWDDLKGLDLEGKVVLVLHGTPHRDGEPVLPAKLEEKYGSALGTITKLVNIARSKPQAIIIPPGKRFSEYWDKRDDLGFWPKILLAEKEGPYYSWIHTDLPRFGLIGTNFIMAKPDWFRMVMKGEKYCPFADDGSLTLSGYTTFTLETTIGFDFTHQDKKLVSWNVVGLIPGTDPEPNSRFICTGAHLDHFPPRNGQVMNGADDNASGVAGVIEIAEAIQLKPTRCSQLFVLFSSEETGLLGSRHFVKNCPVSLDSVKAYLNLDMIGRTSKELVESQAHYLSTDTELCPELYRLITRINSETVNMPLKLREGLEFVIRTDQAYFHQRGIPSANFDSGPHEDIHRPTDTADKIDYDKMEKISRLVYFILQELGNRPDSLDR